MKVFSTRLRELREEKGLSQMQLSKAVGLAQSSIAHWEKGERIPNALAIVELVRYFGVSADYILGVED